MERPNDTTQAMTPTQPGAVLVVAGSQLLALTLWFSASVVAPQLEELWALSAEEASGLTLAVQIGFVVGALALATLNVADRVPSRTLFASAAVFGAGVNSLLLTLGPSDYGWAFLPSAGQSSR